MRGLLTALFSVSILVLASGLGACSDASSNKNDGGPPDDGGFVSTLLDPNFGEQGILRARSSWSTDGIFAGTRAEDGKFLLGGTTINVGHISQILLVRFTSDGQADAEFGNGGIKLIPLYDYVRVTGLATLPDGAAVFSGTAYFDEGIGLLAKVNAQGDLDPAFGEGGLVTWEAGFHENTAVAAEGDAKVLVLSANNPRSQLRRFNPDGSPDTGFGSEGIAELEGEEPRELVLLADGKILVLTAGYDEAYLHRLTPSGDPDSGFAGGGRHLVPFLAHDLALSPSGDEILLAGFGEFGNQLQKLTADGAPVAAFGTDSLVDVEARGELVQVEWHSSGEIFLLEASVGGYPNCHFRAIIRLDADGAPLDFDDSAFLGFGAALNKRLLSDDSGLYLLGSRDLSIPDDTPAHMDSQAAVLGFAPDGTPLENFGTGGLALAGSGAAPEVMWSMLSLPDGTVIAAGSAGVYGVLTRYRDGQQDLSFGGDGFADDFHSQFSRIAADGSGRILALSWYGTVIRFQADGTWEQDFLPDQLPGTGLDLSLDDQGRILVCGGTSEGNGSALLARYNSDGTLDPGFGDAGVVLGIDAAEAGSYAWTLFVDGAGKILVTGEYYPSGGFPGSYIARFNPGGGLDASFGDDGKIMVEGGGRSSRIIARTVGGYLLTTHPTFGTGATVHALDGSGQPDDEFGAGGKVTVESKRAGMHGLLELADGRILLAESVIGDRIEQLAVWCLRPDGTLDSDFDEDGLFVLPGQGRAVGLVPDGNGVIVGGHLFSPQSGTDLALLRIIP